MTSGELLNKRFEKARMGGYKTTEVEAFLAQAASAFAELTRENSDLKQQVSVLHQQTAEVEADKDSLRDALLSAQKFADSLVHEAQQQADQILSDARGKADRLTESVKLQVEHEKKELVRIQNEVTAFRSRLLKIYREHLEVIGAIPVEGQGSSMQSTSEEGPLEDEPRTLEDAESSRKAEPAAAKKEGASVPHTADHPNAISRTQAAAAEASTKEIKSEPVSSPSEKPAQTPTLHLNMRYDERTGEYIPMSENASED